MPSHFSSIGLPLESQEDFDAMIEKVGPLAKPTRTPHGAYWRWQSGCGAEIWLQTSENNLVGVNPHYQGEARLRAVLTARIDREVGKAHEGGFYGWAEPQSADPESGLYPFVFDMPDFDLEADLDLPCVVVLHLAAFAHEVTIFPSVEAFNATESDGPKFASQSFIPAGLFQPEGEPKGPPQAMAIFTGHVVETAERKNPLTGARYLWAEVASLGGSFDVVIDPTMCKEPPQKGGVISGMFWLTGRIAEQE